MAGLDKIIERIRSDTKSQCRSISETSEKNIRLLTEKAENEAKIKADAVIAAAQREAELIREKAVSGSRQKTNQIMLAAKSDTINGILSEALDVMNSLPNDEYFEAVYSLIVKYSENRKNGVVFFNEKDLKRLPDNFEDKLRSAGVDVTISKEPNDAIDSGFILTYGDIEENCTFGALADEKRDILKEKIYKIIF